jgi:hypothetical protein
MTLTINVHRADFHNLFQTYGRKANFSYQGLNILYEYLEDLSDCIGEDINIDIIALCCEYSESNVFNIAEDYNIDIGDLVGEAEVIELVLSYLDENTMVAGRHGSSIVFQQF